MPKVPVYNRQVQETSLPAARLDDSAPIEAFGGGAASRAKFNAIGNAAGVIGDIAQKEKDYIDNAQFQAADTQAAKAQTDLQIKISNLKGRNSYAAPNVLKDEWEKTVKDLSQGLSGNGLTKFQGAVANRGEALNGFASKHVNSENEKANDAEDMDRRQVFIDRSRVNAFDDELLGHDLADAHSTIDSFASRKGIPKTLPDGKPNPTYTQLLNGTLSVMHQNVVEARLEQGHFESAKKHFKEAKESGQLTGKVLEATSALLDSAQVIDDGNKIWAKVKNDKNFLLPGGGVNEQAIRELVSTSLKGRSLKNAKATQSYLDSLITDSVIMENKRQKDLDTAVINQALNGKKKGVPLGQALLNAQGWGGDSLSISKRQAAVAKMYDNQKTTDHVRVREIENSIVFNTDTHKNIEDKIDRGLAEGWMGWSDWKALKDKLRSNVINNTKEETKIVYKQIESDLTNRGIKGKQEEAEFMSLLRSETIGKSPSEIKEIYLGLVSEDKKSGTTILGFSFGKEPNWKTELAQREQTNKEWIGLYNNIGQQEVKAIGNFLLESGQTFDTKSVERFAQEFGGMDSVRAGAPVNNAIRNLMVMKNPDGTPVVVSPANIRFYLTKFPTGNPDGR